MIYLVSGYDHRHEYGVCSGRKFMAIKRQACGVSGGKRSEW